MIGCCGDLVCEQLDDGAYQCMDHAECRSEWNGCDDKPCCGSLTCVEHADGTKQCRDLPVCAKAFDDCSLVGCCGDLKCTDVDGRKQCLDLPTCWDTEWADCSLAPCCEGGDKALRCIEGQGRKVCAHLPQCMDYGMSCLWAPCCETKGGAEVACVDVSDKHGRTAKQCRYQPYDAKIRAWGDINLNGIMDEGEAGIPGVQIRLLTQRNPENVLEDQQDGGNAHEILTTDKDGYVTFKKVPRGLLLRAYVVKAPIGTLPTYQNRGADKTKSSQLENDGFSNWFRINADENIIVHTMTNLGYQMPSDAEVRVFDDLNANGLQDEGEPGIAGVELKLVYKGKGDVEDMKNGGNAHQVLTTDKSGQVVFTKLPLGSYLRVFVVKAPYGSVPTKRDANGHGWDDNDDKDSDLLKTGVTNWFIPKAGPLRSSIDLGYITPGSSTVRVWDDQNSNGIQDEGEPGIPGVELRLVKFSEEPGPKPVLEDQKNGGNAHQILTTDDNGLVTFTEVRRKIVLKCLLCE